MNHLLLLVLRILHIGGGAFWFGGALMNMLFVVPTVRALGPAGGPFMGHLIGVRRLPLWMTATGVVTILSGLWLYGWRSAWFTSPWMTSGPGLTYGIGGLFAILTVAIGGAVMAPAGRRLGQLTAAIQGGAPTPEQAAELARLQRRMGIGGLVSTVFLVLALVAMAVARYH